MDLLKNGGEREPEILEQVWALNSFFYMFFFIINFLFVFVVWNCIKCKVVTRLTTMWSGIVDCRFLRLCHISWCIYKSIWCVMLFMFSSKWIRVSFFLIKKAILNQLLFFKAVNGLGRTQLWLSSIHLQLRGPRAAPSLTWTLVLRSDSTCLEIGRAKSPC